MLSRINGFAFRRGDIAEPRFRRRPAKVSGQRGRDLRLTLGDEPLDTTQLIEPPLQRTCAPNGEHLTQFGHHLSRSGRRDFRRLNNHRWSP
jgi:hypothetical protein